jgi:hypothetical protein
MKNLNRILITLSLIILNIYAYGQIHSNDFKEPYSDYRGVPLKGYVKSIVEVEYSAVDYFGELKRDSIYETFFVNLNNKNFIISGKEIKNGVETLVELTYINQNKIKEVRAVVNNTNTELIKFKYDNQGNIIECNTYKGDTLTGKEIAIYDINNNEIEFKRYNKKGSLADKETHKYDLKGRLIEFEGLYNWGFHSKSLYKYNNKLKVECLHFDKETLDSKTNYKYYESGKIKEEIEESINKSYVTKFVSQYNSDGNFVKKTRVDSDGKK